MAGKKPNNLLYSLSLVIPILAISGNLIGGSYTLLTIGWVILFSIPDLIFQYPDKAPWGADETFNDVLLILISILNTLVLFSLLYSVSHTIVSGIFLFTAVLSTGLAMGSIGNLAAHELIHRRSKLKYAGLWNLFLVNYAHYYVEHIQFHHRYVATDLDPSSAKINESFYTFLFRLIPAQIKEVWEYEKQRLIRKQQSWLSLENFIVQQFIFKSLFLVLIYIYAGLIGLAVYFLTCLIVRVIHESITYTQHYGLARDPGARVDISHSWQSNSLVSEYFSLALTRHSDHHWHATTTYPNLISYEKAPTLPAGYISILPIVWIPPLWFKIINPRITTK